MIVLHNLSELISLQGELPSIGVTIGNFDGFHLGHQSLIENVKYKCIESNSKTVVITFNPHPQKILNPEKEKFLISSYDKKRKLLSSFGVDFLVELSFTRDFSTLSAADFLEKFIFIYPRIHTIYLGYDFAFGANKQGSHELVKNICQKRAVNVEIQPKFEFEGLVISSSLIRSKLLGGELESVHRFLGRPYLLEGVVVKGEGRGKKIGFPTANIQVGNDLIMPHKGVYITRTHYRDMTYESITNVGSNPTFKENLVINIETNIFDFDLDIYGEKIEIEFLKKIRDEKKFSTVNDLINQIKLDVDNSRNYFKKI